MSKLSCQSFHQARNLLSSTIPITIKFNLGFDDVLIEIDEINVSKKGSNNDFDIKLPPTKETKVNYNRTCKFQIKWVTKLN
jgi:hypothetical protein